MTFDEAERSPRYAELMAFTPDTSSTGAGCFSLFFLMLGAIAGFMTLAFLLLGSQLPLPQVGAAMALVPGLMCAGSLWAFFAIRRRVREFQAAPLERVLAIVRDETVETRTETVSEPARHRGGLRRSRTRVVSDHYVVLELKSGDRQSHEVTAELARLVVKGDVGVAYLKAGVLIDFKPLPAPQA